MYTKVVAARIDFGSINLRMVAQSFSLQTSGRAFQYSQPRSWIVRIVTEVNISLRWFLDDGALQLCNCAGSERKVERDTVAGRADLLHTSSTSLLSTSAQKKARRPAGRKVAMGVGRARTNADRPTR